MPSRISIELTNQPLREFVSVVARGAASCSCASPTRRVTWGHMESSTAVGCRGSQRSGHSNHAATYVIPLSAKMATCVATVSRSRYRVPFRLPLVVGISTRKPPASTACMVVQSCAPEPQPVANTVTKRRRSSKFKSEEDMLNNEKETNHERHRLSDEERT